MFSLVIGWLVVTLPLSLYSLGQLGDGVGAATCHGGCRRKAEATATGEKKAAAFATGLPVTRNKL